MPGVKLAAGGRPIENRGEKVRCGCLCEMFHKFCHCIITQPDLLPTSGRKKFWSPVIPGPNLRALGPRSKSFDPQSTIGNRRLRHHLPLAPPPPKLPPPKPPNPPPPPPPPESPPPQLPPPNPPPPQPRP